MNIKEINTLIEEKIDRFKEGHFIISKTSGIGTIVGILIAIATTFGISYKDISRLNLSGKVEEAEKLMVQIKNLHDEVDKYAYDIKNRDIPKLINEFDTSETGKQYLKKADFKWNKIVIDNSTFPDSLEYMFVITFAVDNTVKVGDMFFVDAVFPQELSKYTNDARFLIRSGSKNELYYQGNKIGAIDLYGRTLLK